MIAVEVDATLLIGAIIALAGTGAATALVTQWFERRNRMAEANRTGAEAELADAQATDVLVQAGKTAVEILTQELNRALDRIEKLEAAAVRAAAEAAEKDERIAHLEAGEREKDKRIGHLESQVESLEQHIAELHGED